MNDRESLARALYVSRRPGSTWEYMTARQKESYLRSADRLVNHFELLGYQKARSVTTLEEVDALPFESVIRDAEGHVLERWGEPEENLWVTVMVNAYIERDDIALPATVLHEPAAAA